MDLETGWGDTILSLCGKVDLVCFVWTMAWKAYLSQKLGIKPE
jgi:hypothetical protein